MDILFTICGRSGSKGVKNKNLKEFNGIPLVYYTLGAIYEYKKDIAIQDNVEIVINTDSEELIQLVCKQKELPIHVIRRTEDLSGDAVPKVSVIKDCLEKCEIENSKKYDVVVDLDITSPLRTVEDIDNAIKKKLTNSHLDVVYSVTEARRSPYFNMVKEKEDGCSELVIQSNYTARQQAPKLYDMNASIYVYSPRALKEKAAMGFFASNCSFIVMKDTGILDIDSEDDFELMQVISNFIFQKYPQYDSIYSAGKMLWTV